MRRLERIGCKPRPHSPVFRLNRGPRPGAGVLKTQEAALQQREQQQLLLRRQREREQRRLAIRESRRAVIFAQAVSNCEVLITHY